MATISVTEDLDVLNKYTSLVSESLGSGSVYIRAKETIEELAANGDLKDADKAKVMSEVLTSLSTSLTNACMSTALQWAANEKDIALKKLELAKQLDILDEDILLRAAQVEKMKDDTIATQAQTIRMYGTPVVVDGEVTGLSDEGKVFNEIQMLEQQTANAVKEGVLLDSKKKESQAAIHKVVADTYRNYGSYTYVLADGGLSGVSKTSGTYETLSDIQEAIAKQQANGYAYNAWANAATSTSSMLGTALAAEIDNSNQAISDLVAQIAQVSTDLSGAKVPYTEYTTP